MYTSNFCQLGSMRFNIFSLSFSLLFALPLFFFTSCRTTKAPTLLKYTSRDTTIGNFVNSVFEIKIQKEDILSINVSSLNIEDDKVFNAAISISSGNSETKSAGNGYHVGQDGNIYMHRLGNVPAAGLTRKELKMQLEKQLQPYFKDPIVTVNFENHRVTMLGEVSRPQILSLPSEKISVFDAIAASGSVTATARLNDVVIIRETTGAKEFKHLNLTDYSIFTSSWYYLQPNDIVLVHPDEVSINEEKRRVRNQQVFATALQLVTITVIIIQNFFK